MAKPVRTKRSPGNKAAYEHYPIDDSATIYKDSFVRMGDGGIEAINAASDDIGYICRGFIQPGKTGFMPLENVSSGNYSGTLTTTAGSENYAAAADNTTVDMVYAVCEPVKRDALYRMQLDDTRGTTTGSDTVGYHISTTNGIQLDEDTAASSATPLQFIIAGIPADESDVVDVKVREHQNVGDQG